MSTAPQNDDDWTPDALKRRIGNYISRIVAYNSGWGIHGRGKRPDGFYGHFFRFDANRMTRMVLACEHLIRCMIIWMALRAYRDTDIQPANFRFPTGGPRGPRPPEPPIDPLFKLYAKPLYEPRLPPFLISLPEPRLAGSALSATHREAGGQTKMSLRATGSSKRKRPRNDQILDCNLLVDRSHRLSKLLDEIDPRARRLAARWAGYLTNSAADHRIPGACHRDPSTDASGDEMAGDGWQEQVLPTRSIDTGTVSTSEPQAFSPLKRESGPKDRAASSFSLNPLKTYWPPPELLTEAAEDEAEDIRELHDVALRATEAFIGLCR